MKLYSDSEDLIMYVDNEGGYLDSLTDKGQNIIYPIEEIILEDGNKKIRGGIHPCIPNFGKDELKGLNSHGYGRDFKWELAGKGESYTALFLRGMDEYARLDSYLNYEIKDNMLRMNLTFRNQDNKEILIAPGFHPYFQSKDSYVKVDGKEFSKEELMNTVFINSDSLEFETDKYKFKYICKNVNTFAIWTDFLGDYICVEPTYNGPSFMNSWEENPYPLQSKEKLEFEAIVSWEPIK